MGVLPLEFMPGENRGTLELTGEEIYAIKGLEAALVGDKIVTVRAGAKAFRARVRIDTPTELDYYRHGGILKYVLRRLAQG
jgi:aconitate hydratase